VSEHVHTGRWLPEPIYVFDAHFRLVAVNAKCVTCGARFWAHGRMPCDSRPPLAQTDPHDTRS